MFGFKNIFKNKKIEGNKDDRENFTVYAKPQKQPKKTAEQPITPYQEYALAKEQYNRVMAMAPDIPGDFESQDAYASDVERVTRSLELAEAHIAEYEEAMAEMLDREYELEHAKDNNFEYERA